MPKPRVLISGASIAGPSLAFWLARAGAQVTIVERAPALRTGGQTVDLRGAGREVVRRMGLEEVIRSKTTQEQGLAFVDSKNRRRAEFPVDKSGKGSSFTSEIEILRGELAKTFYDATSQDVEYVFGDSIKALAEKENEMQVTFANETTRDFDLVVAADGLGSRTRALIFGEGQDDKAVIKSLGQYTAYFTIPASSTDAGGWARWYNAPGRRCILLRPDGVDTPSTRAFVSIMSTEERVRSFAKLDMDGQKAMMNDLFKDAGWETARVLEGMAQADDFYMQHIAQVKLPAWSKGRGVVVGDAGYCPSPISGMGTSVAVVGSYVLAGEIAKHTTAAGGVDYQAAFRGYEDVLRRYVTNAQSLPPGAPAIANPETTLGIEAFNSILGAVSWASRTRLVKWLMGSGSGSPTQDTWLPQYEMKMSTL